MRQRGMTLIELLAGMALLGTALALFTTAELAARRTAEHHAVLFDLQQDRQRLCEFLDKDLTDALDVVAAEKPVPVPDEPVAGYEVLRLTMAGQDAAGNPQASVRDIVTYELLPESDGRWRLRRTVVPGDGSQRVRDTRDLSRRLLGLDVFIAPPLVDIRFRLHQPSRLSVSMRPRLHVLHVERRPVLGGSAR